MRVKITSRSAMILFLSSAFSSCARISAAVAWACCSFIVRLPGGGGCVPDGREKSINNHSSTDFVDPRELTLFEKKKNTSRRLLRDRRRRHDNR